METVLVEAIAAAKAAGVLGAMVFFWLWQRAEKRIENLQERNEQLIERVFTALSDTKDALRELRGMFGARNDR
jgi:membrane protein implicated in regulation of membrane protease activity